MFLSRIEIPWSMVRNPYDIHRGIWRLFPEAPGESRQSGTEQRVGFLFRREAGLVGQSAPLLVQSRQPPQPADGVKILGCREFQPQPQVGQRLAFVLTANPIKTIVDAEVAAKPNKRPNQQGQYKCRVPLLDEEQQRRWLIRHLTAIADVEAMTVVPHEPLYFRKGQRGGKLVTVTFEGVLQVKAPDELVGLLENGIGPAKAFGCGLLLVRRI
ncbi:MAG: system Cascade subunit CasE [Pseudomonadota bacterium]|nr:system Cascade subunit CasE [Pseudomonadota bacterium]